MGCKTVEVWVGTESSHAIELRLRSERRDVDFVTLLTVQTSEVHVAVPAVCKRWNRVDVGRCERDLQRANNASKYLCRGERVIPCLSHVLSYIIRG